MVSVALKGVHEAIRHFARVHFIGAKDLAHFDHLLHHETAHRTPHPFYMNGSIPQAMHSVLLGGFMNCVKVSLKGVNGVKRVSDVFLRGIADIHLHLFLLTFGMPDFDYKSYFLRINNGSY